MQYPALFYLPCDTPILRQKDAIMFCNTEKRQYRKLGGFILGDTVDPDMLNPLLEAAIRVRQKGQKT